MPKQFLSQMDLPVPASDPKSPIRKQEFDAHTDSTQHVPTGVIGQMLVMTSQGPRMMFAIVQCDGNYDPETRYSSSCQVVYNDIPPQP